VPVVHDGRLIGVLDLDSPRPARFDSADQQGLEALVARVDRPDGLLSRAEQTTSRLGDTLHGADAVGDQLIDTLRAAEQAARSLRLLTDALEAEPDDGAIVDSLGWVLFKRGDLKGARRARIAHVPTATAIRYAPIAPAATRPPPQTTTTSS
jgi:predicted Zn-dependent protease